MRASQLFSYLAACVALTGAAPVFPRAVIDHGKVVGFPETVPSGQLGAQYLQHKPYLKVVNGCVPFPAVDAEGNTSGGLKPTGAAEGHCSSSTGQVYARGADYNGRYAIMYAWYMPKDSPSSSMGHRHDWECSIVWLDSLASGNVVGVSASGHGKFDTVTGGDMPLVNNARPKIRYYSQWPLNHQTGFTSEQGGEQPLIAWESLTDAARTALTNTDFGDANVPFKDGNFVSNLGKAAF